VKNDRLIRSDRIIRPGQYDTERPSDPPRLVPFPAPRESRASQPSEAPASNREARAGRDRSADASRREARASAAPARAAAPEGATRELANRSKPSAASSSTIEEGTDLTFGRRVPLVRIDSENPYQ
jgi:hypothetical protein